MCITVLLLFEITKINSKDPFKQHLAQTFNKSLRYLLDMVALNNYDFRETTSEIYPLNFTLALFE